MTMSSGAPTQYFFRGMLQSDQGFIWQANAELDVALYDSEELQFITPINFWFSLHPGDPFRRPRVPQVVGTRRLISIGAAERGRRAKHSIPSAIAANGRTLPPLPSAGRRSTFSVDTVSANSGALMGPTCASAVRSPLPIW